MHHASVRYAYLYQIRTYLKSGPWFDVLIFKTKPCRILEPEACREAPMKRKHPWGKSNRLIKVTVVNDCPLGVKISTGGG